MRRSSIFRAGLALAVLFGLQLAFWRLRLHLPGTPLVEDIVPYAARDLWFEHTPLAMHVAERLRLAELPLWDPHRLCGLPLLAVPHGATLYPPTLLNALIGLPAATEVSLILHLAFAAICTFGFMRSVGAHPAGAFSAALGFAWCSSLVAWTYQHVWLVGLSWMPATLWLVERTLCRRPRSASLLALAVGVQLLAGGTEAVVFNLYASGSYAAVRLLTLAAGGEAGRALGRGAVLLGAVCLGALVAAPQLLMSFELVGESARIERPFDPVAARAIARPMAGQLEEALAGGGLLALLGVILGWRVAGARAVWIWAVLMGLAAAPLATGGLLYQLYQETPVGALFRWPVKFMALQGMALAVLAGLGVTRLVELARGEPRSREAGWAAAVSAGTVVGAWVLDVRPLAGAVLTAGLAIVALARGTRAREAAVLALVFAAAAHLFWRPPQHEPRPYARRDALLRFEPLFRELTARAGHQRVYLSGHLAITAGVGPNRALISGFDSPNGYEALAPARHRDFFEALGARWEGPFAGVAFLRRDARFQLLDVAATRFFVLRRDEPLDRFLSRPEQAAALGFRPAELPGLGEEAPLRIWERPSALPRFRFVPEATLARDPSFALSALLSPGWRAEQRVVLEHREVIPTFPRSRATGRVEALTVEPERLELEVEADGPGFVVVADSWFPGWKARLGGVEVPILRADHLFRAVQVPAGRSRLELEYTPARPKLGLGIALLVLATLLAAETLGQRRRLRASARPDRPIGPRRAGGPRSP